MRRKQMGRPLNKKYFGNRNTPPVGGEGVASVTLVNRGSYTTRPTVTFAAPSLAGGVTATGTVSSEAVSAAVTAGGTGYLVGDLLTVTTAGGTAVFAVATLAGDGSTGQVATVTVDSAGVFTTLAAGAQATTTDSVAGANATLTITYRAAEVVITDTGGGYTSAPTATFTQSVTGTAVLTATRENAITVTGRVVAGSTVSLDVIKQTGSRRYLVTDGTNVGVVKLASSTVAAAGEASIVATDSDGGTYFVTKLTAHRALVTPGTGTQFSANQSVPWVLDTAEANVSVLIPSA
jgi:hypothetical protein